VYLSDVEPATAKALCAVYSNQHLSFHIKCMRKLHNVICAVYPKALVGPHGKSVAIYSASREEKKFRLLESKWKIKYDLLRN